MSVCEEAEQCLCRGLPKAIGPDVMSEWLGDL